MTNVDFDQFVQLGSDIVLRRNNGVDATVVTESFSRLARTFLARSEDRSC